MRHLKLRCSANNGNGTLERVAKDAVRFSDIEWRRADAAKKIPLYNAPFTHSRQAYMTLNAKWSSAGIPVGTPYVLEGHVTTDGALAAPSPLFKFSSGTLQTTGNAETTAAMSEDMTSEYIGKDSRKIYLPEVALGF